MLFVKSSLEENIQTIGQEIFHSSEGKQNFFTYSGTNISKRLALIKCVYHFTYTCLKIQSMLWVIEVTSEIRIDPEFLVPYVIVF